MRLIDADALDMFERLNSYYGDAWRDAQKEIDEAPTVDAVPVIRCKDCKKFVVEEDQAYCLDMYGQCDGNGFCAWAERKEE